MSWKKLRGVGLPYEKQVLIRATCLLWQEQPPEVQEKIRRLCESCGGVYACALRDVMCTKKSVTQAAMEHHVSERELYRRRVAFYQAW